MTELRGILGFGLHIASLAMHDAAAKLLVPPSFSAQPPRLWMARQCGRCAGRGMLDARHSDEWCPECGGSGEDATDIELVDVAPWCAELLARWIP
jgi:hypothetical protein